MLTPRTDSQKLLKLPIQQFVTLLMNIEIYDTIKMIVNYGSLQNMKDINKVLANFDNTLSKLWDNCRTQKFVICNLVFKKNERM